MLERVALREVLTSSRNAGLVVDFAEKWQQMAPSNGTSSKTGGFGGGGGRQGTLIKR